MDFMIPFCKNGLIIADLFYWCMLLFLILKPIRTVVKDDQQIIKIEIRIITKTAGTDSIRKIREKEDAKKAQKR